MRTATRCLNDDATKSTWPIRAKLVKESRMHNVLWWTFVIVGIYLSAVELYWWWAHPSATAMEVMQAFPEWVWPW